LAFEWKRLLVSKSVVVVEKDVVVVEKDAVVVEKDAVVVEKDAVDVVAERVVAKDAVKVAAVVAEEEVGMVAAEDAVMDEARGVRVVVKDEERAELVVEVEAEDAELASILWMSRLSRLCKQGVAFATWLGFMGVESSLVGYLGSPLLEEFIGATTKVTD
jgi:hypothetical protein